MTADVPDNELCHPPSFTAVGMSIGPTFGSSKTGDWTYTGQGRNLTPFGEQHNFGVQSQGEYLYYHGRHEGQIDIGLVDRWKKVQFGVFGDFKFAEFGLLKDGGVLGQASAVADLLFSKVRVSIFASKGFKDIGLLSTDSSVVFTSVPGPGTSADIARLEHVARVADTLGGGVLFGVGPKNDIEGNLMWLRRQKPTTLSDKAGAMARFTHHFSSKFALYGEVTLNETLVGSDEQRPRSRRIRLRPLDAPDGFLQQAHTARHRCAAGALRPGHTPAVSAGRSSRVRSAQTSSPSRRRRIMQPPHASSGPDQTRRRSSLRVKRRAREGRGRCRPRRAIVNSAVLNVRDRSPCAWRSTGRAGRSRWIALHSDRAGCRPSRCGPTVWPRFARCGRA